MLWQNAHRPACPAASHDARAPPHHGSHSHAPRQRCCGHLSAARVRVDARPGPGVGPRGAARGAWGSGGRSRGRGRPPHCPQAHRSSAHPCLVRAALPTCAYDGAHRGGRAGRSVRVGAPWPRRAPVPRDLRVQSRRQPRASLHRRVHRALAHGHRRRGRAAACGPASLGQCSRRGERAGPRRGGLRTGRGAARDHLTPRRCGESCRKLTERAAPTPDGSSIDHAQHQ
mmetsp:Transcript_406/g.1049  ORF Transcript_406/g.1049 Transcript_406/m.1049 type:complete len:228 (-) Transcript_406:400-1083(-)